MRPLAYKDLSLEELLLRYRDSDPHAFREFFSRTSRTVFQFLRGKLTSHADAEDVLQETYFRVHRYITTFDTSRKALPWILHVAKNAMLDHLKARKKHFYVDLENVQTPHPQRQHDEMAELRQLLFNALQGLRTEEANHVIERLLNDTAHDEIAEELGISVGSARQRLSRLIRRLKASLSAQ